MIKWSKKVKLPPDLFSRNTFFALIIEELLKEKIIAQKDSQKRVKILDVGGLGTKLAWFLPPEVELTVLGQNPKPTDGHIQYVQGDFLNLPFEDKSFDLVLSCDTFQALVAGEQENFLNELNRVSSRYIVIASPFQSIINEKAEEYIFSQYQEITGQIHPLFIQNQVKDLPDLEEVENYLIAKKYSYFKLGEGNIYNRYLLQLAENTELIFAEKNLNQSVKFKEFFNKHLSELGNFRQPTYRTVLCIDKENILNKHHFIQLIEEKNNFHSSVYFEALKTLFDQLNALAKGYQKNLIESDKVKSLQNKVDEQEFAHLKAELKLIIDKQGQELNLLSAQLNELRTLLNENEEKAQARSEIIKNQQIELEQKSQALFVAANQNELLEKQIASQENFLAKLGTELELKNKEIESLKNIVIQKEHNINQRIQEIKQKNTKIAEIQNELEEYKQKVGTIRNSFWGKAMELHSRIKQKLASLFGQKKGRNEVIAATSDEYQLYLEKTALNQRNIKEIQNKILQFQYRPLISIILEVEKIEKEEYLRKTLDSVKAQLYSKWELHIIDYAEQRGHHKAIIDEYCQKDSRIKVIAPSQFNRAYKILNKALNTSQGAYVSFIKGGDEMPINALYELIQALQEKKYDLIYTDEDELTEEGKHLNPHFKPGLSLDFLLGWQNLITNDLDSYIQLKYPGHLLLYRRKILQEIGDFREGVEKFEHADLLLRYTEKQRSIYHVPQVLYHAREITEPKILPETEKETCLETVKKILKDTLKNRKIKGEIIEDKTNGKVHLKNIIEGEPMVSIIIPFKDQVGVLKECLDGIFEKTTYKNYEIILINNASELLESIEYLKEVENCPRVRLLHYNGTYNYSAMTNFAAQQAQGNYLLLLRNDIEIVEPQWIENMLEYAQKIEVGAVGGKIITKENKVHHAGIMVGFGGVSNYPLHDSKREQQDNYGLQNMIRKVSAVSAACMMLRKEVYEKMDGLDEENLAINFYDLDLCLRLGEAGYLIVYTPYAVLCQKDDQTSDQINTDINEKTYIIRRHHTALRKNDPYYNPNLRPKSFNLFQISH